MLTGPRMPYRMTSDRPRLPPPGGAALAVLVRAPLPMPTGRDPDAGEYALRAGLPRLMRLLDDRGVKPVAPMPAAMIDAFPAVAAAALASGWEIAGQGDDPAAVADDVAALAAFAGAPVRDWRGPSDDPMAQALRAAGVTRLHGRGVDDLPVWRLTDHGPLLLAPRALALGWAGPEAMLARFRAGLATLAAEAADQPRVLTLSLPPDRAGAPEHVGAVAAMLDLALERHDAKPIRAAALEAWYATAIPPPAGD